MENVCKNLIVIFQLYMYKIVNRNINNDALMNKCNKYWKIGAKLLNSLCVLLELLMTIYIIENNQLKD